MSTFEFVRLGIPCTVQTKNRDRLANYRQDVRRAAASLWSGNTSALIVPVRVIISYYYTDDILDVDNLIKPVLDQLKGLVYVDDSQVVEVTCRKADVLGGAINAADTTPPLAVGLRSKHDFLHVMVEWR